MVDSEIFAVRLGRLAVSGHQKMFAQVESFAAIDQQIM